MARLLHVKPRIVVPSNKEFIATHPNFSVALDGYVGDGPMFIPKVNGRGPFANFDHHVGVNRSATRSTCYQAYVAITQGFFDTFQKDGEYEVNIFANNCDQDVCLSVWEFMNPERLHRSIRSRRIDDLVMAEDLLDSSGGSYPIDEKYYSEPRFLHKLAWIFAPYTTPKFEGKVETMDAEGMQRVITEVGSRITLYVNGQGEEIEPDARYEVIDRRKGYVVILEQGPFARRTLFTAEPEDAYVSIRQNPDGSKKVIVGKMSQYIILPMEKVAEMLNQLEGLKPSSENCWNGGDTIIGSPLLTGTKLGVPEICKTIDEAIAAERKSFLNH